MKKIFLILLSLLLVGACALPVGAEEVTEVLLYNQLDYPTTPYDNYGTVRSHGCGIGN